ncbi:MAG: hypothetical protein LBM94_01005 [Propionibacteriaceae bacterium]|nr:hypothetical protein [Propionibacteriaceae bacterium]
MAAPNDDDARFAELIREGFGVDVSGPAPKETEVRSDAAPPEGPSPSRPAFVMPDAEYHARSDIGTTGSKPTFFDFDEAFERADRNPDDFDAFRPPVAEPLGRPHTPLGWFALGCLVLSVTLLALALWGVSFPPNVVLADILVVIGSIAMIWKSTPKRPTPYEEYGDGVRL